MRKEKELAQWSHGSFSFLIYYGPCSPHGYFSFLHSPFSFLLYYGFPHFIIKSTCAETFLLHDEPFVKDGAALFHTHAEV